MRIPCMLAAGVLLCTPAVAATAAEDLLAFYQENIHALPSGVYEREGWFFFHQRGPVPEARGPVGGGLRALAWSRTVASRAIADKIEELIASNKVEITRPASVLKAYVSRFDAERRVARSFQVDSKVLSSDEDGGEFVYDMAVSREAILAEAAKGRWEDRIQPLCESWRKVARDESRGPGAVAFVQACGGLDIYCPSNDATNCPCPADVKAEYARSIEALRAGLPDELFACVPKGTYAELEKLVLGMDAGGLSVQFERSRDLQAFDASLETADDAARTQILLELLSHTPGSRLYWQELGGLCCRTGKFRLGVVCYRYALRLNRVKRVWIPLLGLARCYRALGYSALADSAAVLAYGLAEDEKAAAEALSLLEDVK